MRATGTDGKPAKVKCLYLHFAKAADEGGILMVRIRHLTADRNVDGGHLESSGQHGSRWS
jgi:hypothetical protein